MTLVKKCGVLARMVNFVSGNTSGTEIRLNMDDTYSGFFFFLTDAHPNCPEGYF
jgi:hypothetical protein